MGSSRTRSALGWLGVLVALTGCPNRNTPVEGTTSVDDAGCFYYCADPCRGVGVCVAWPFFPACVAPCDSDNDCSSGLQCVVLTTPGIVASNNGVCVAPSLPKICGADRPCPSLTPMCKDGQTLMQPLTRPLNLCGYELVPCANGCDGARAKCL